MHLQRIPAKEVPAVPRLNKIRENHYFAKSDEAIR